MIYDNINVIIYYNINCDVKVLTTVVIIIVMIYMEM